MSGVQFPPQPPLSHDNSLPRKALAVIELLLPPLYYPIAAAGVIFFLCGALNFSSGSLTSRRGEWLFLASIGICLFGLRWWFFLWPNSTNIDEGQWAASAVKATRNILPWLGVDANSSGPLNIDVLLLPALLGAKITLFSDRIVGVLLVMGSLWAIYFALKWLYGPSIGRLAVAAPLLLLAFSKHPELIHYSSEHLPVFLATCSFAAAAFVAARRGSERSQRIMLALAGFCAGCVPFAKLQAAPLALAQLVATGAFLLLSDRRPQRWISSLAILMGSAALMPVILLIGVCYAGTLEDAVISYFGTALVYVQGGAPLTLAFFLDLIPEYRFYLAASGLVILAALAFARKSAWPALSQIWGWSCAAMLVGASIYAICVARRPHPHYLMLSIMPIGLLTGNALGLMFELPLSAGARRGLSLAFVAVFLPAATIGALSPTGYAPKLRPPPQPELVALTRYAKPGDLMAVWGWAPDYYVHTETIMATRDAQTSYQIKPGKYREYFRQRFMRDLTQNPPSVFIDAVAPGAFIFDDRATDGMETFPALASFVREHYALKEEINGVRIFVRENQAAAKTNSR